MGLLRQLDKQQTRDLARAEGIRVLSGFQTTIKLDAE